MRTSFEINHHSVRMIKFRALGTHYPTGKYKKAYNKEMDATLKWFVLEIDCLEITWYSDWIKGEEE